MRVLVFISNYLPGYKAGGPIKSLSNIVKYTSDKVKFNIFTSDRDLGDLKPYENVDVNVWNERSDCNVFYGKGGLSWFINACKFVFSRKHDLIYLNSFFSIKYSLIPLLLAKLINKNVLIAARGEFSEGALSLKSRRKKIYIFLYKFFRLHTKTTYQCSTLYEKKDLIKALGTNVDVFIAGNISSQEYAKDLNHKELNSLNVVFLSRISPKKNLLKSLQILSNIKHPIVYDIYGPIEDKDYWNECLQVIKSLPENVHVNYRGAVTSEEVVSVLSKYDLFFMPTKGENYGHVIAEALSAGLLVLIADTTPWRNLQELGIGWDLPLNTPEEYSVIIEQLALTAPDEYLQMRKKVLAWAQSKFSQKEAVESNVSMFRYVFEKN